MVKTETLQTLTRYKSWADEVFDKVLATIPEADLVKQRPMLYSSIIGLCSHVYHMDIVWKSHLLAKQHGFTSRNPDSTLTFCELRKKQKAINEWFVNYADNLPSEKYQEKIDIVFIGGGTGVMSRLEIIQHTINHASYHRGHIEGVFYQMAIEPPTTDFPVFLNQRDSTQ